MWVLKNKSGIVIKFITEGQTVKIGRRGTDITLIDDASISRLHAQIQVKLKPNHSLENSHQHDYGMTECILVDTGSKYGTKILGKSPQNLKPGEPHNLKHDEVVQFGMDQHIYTVQHIPLKILTSGLTRDNKIQLHDILGDMGGEICSNWSENCTHLTVSEVKMTQRLAESLAAALPIVTINFWEVMKNCLIEGKPLPEARDFCAHLDDPMMQMPTISLHPREERKKIFKGLLFVFFCKRQFKLFREMIILAGGTAVCYFEERKIKKRLGEAQTILVQFDEEDAQIENENIPSLETLQEFLRNLNRRLIPESDIPLAILHCSIEKSCNPNFNYQKLLITDGKNPSVENSKILALDTQDIGAGPSKSELRIRKDSINRSHIIPETEEFSQDLTLPEHKLQKKSSREDKSESSNEMETSGTEDKRYSKEVDDLSHMSYPVKENTKVQSEKISMRAPSNSRIESEEHSMGEKSKSKSKGEPKTSIYSNFVGKNDNSSIANKRSNEANEQSIKQPTETQSKLEKKNSRKDENYENNQRKRPGGPFSLSCIKRKNNIREVEMSHPIEENCIQRNPSRQQKTCKENNEQKRVAMDSEEDDEFSLNSRNSKKQKTLDSPDDALDSEEHMIDTISFNHDYSQEHGTQKRKSRSPENNEEFISNPRKKVRESSNESINTVIKNETDDSMTSESQPPSRLKPNEKIKADQSDCPTGNTNMKTVWAPIVSDGPAIEKMFVKLEIKPVVEYITSWKSVAW